MNARIRALKEYDEARNAYDALVDEHPASPSVSVREYLRGVRVKSVARTRLLGAIEALHGVGGVR